MKFCSVGQKQDFLGDIAQSLYSIYIYIYLFSKALLLIGIWKIWQNSPENILGNISQKHPWTYVLGQIPQ